MGRWSAARERDRVERRSRGSPDDAGHVRAIASRQKRARTSEFVYAGAREKEREGRRRNVVDGRHPARSSAVTKARRRRSSISRATTRLSDGGQAERGGPVERRGNEGMRCPFLLTRTRLPFCGLVGTRTTRERGKGAAEATARECVVWRNRETHETDVRDSRKRKRERERERLYLLD